MLSAGVGGIVATLACSSCYVLPIVRSQRPSIVVRWSEAKEARA
jgi:hypothetical protein